MALSLNSEDLPELQRELYDARAKWKHIATQVGSSEGDIEAIAMENHDTTDCLKVVLTTWLRKQTDPLPTRRQLAKALQSDPVGRRDLAIKICPEIHPNIRPKIRDLSFTVYCLIILALILPLILLSLLLFSWWHFEQDCFESLSLPNIKQVLIGREVDMEVIVTYLQDSEVDVVTLFGSAGFGKSEIALHVGHEMLNKGVDVYYIKVEDFTSVDSLEEKLMNISDASYENERLVRWAKGLHQMTLLILDNVDGSYWVQDNQRQKFQTSFLDVLQSQSTQLKILITSQQEIRSKSRFHSHRLLSLSTQGCVQLITLLADGAEMSSSDCEKVCSSG